MPAQAGQASSTAFLAEAGIAAGADSAAKRSEEGESALTVISLNPSRAGSSAQPKPLADGTRLMDENVPKEILNSKSLFAKKNMPDAAFLRHHVRSAQDCIRVRALAVVRKIFIGFRPAVDPLPSTGDVVVFMKLMNNWRKIGQIDNRKPFFSRVLDEPLIEPHSPDRQRWNVLIGAPWKNKEINACMALQPPFEAHAPLESFLPAVAEVQRFPNF